MNAPIVISGVAGEVKGCIDQIRSVAGGDNVFESHILVCYPGKVCQLSLISVCI